ncbi:hypothetical protein [Leifsonia sp. Leaf264]|uniref:hypothetical protein n=1 Tax=Leifsonia sp. Leaf264 TaxID=1736314 RepID=UPI0006F2A1A2|nr:hypothetical protein [Leifsonia sp. Leaf264]KQO98872.1 hypothetical protein ASF30_12480 [Leifsonia sp. Leaf264]
MSNLTIDPAKAHLRDQHRNPFTKQFEPIPEHLRSDAPEFSLAVTDGYEGFGHNEQRAAISSSDTYLEAKQLFQSWNPQADDAEFGEWLFETYASEEEYAKEQGNPHSALNEEFGDVEPYVEVLENSKGVAVFYPAEA